jgi:nucleotide-binding universal stress UspA family protein
LITMNTKSHAPVVVGVDGGAEAIAAARYAAWEAERHGVDLRLVYAHQPTPMWGPSTLISDDYVWEQDWVHTLLQSAKKEVADTHPDLAIEAVVGHGRPAGVLVAESAKASLLVMGTRSAPGVLGRLAGSVAAQVAAHAATPVVVLRSDEPRYAEPAEFAGRPVVVGIDGSEESARAFRFAAEQAVARGSELHAVLVWNIMYIHDKAPLGPDDYTMHIEEEKAQRLLAETTAGAAGMYPDLVVIRRAVHDLDAVQALCHESANAGLLVVGSRGHGGFLGLRLGSTVDALVRQAPVPLAVVRGIDDQQ